jgi:hypothetical protein
MFTSSAKSPKESRRYEHRISEQQEYRRCRRGSLSKKTISNKNGHHSSGQKGDIRAPETEESWSFNPLSPVV